MGERSIGEGQAVKRDECLERRVPECGTSRRASRIENWWCMAFSEMLPRFFSLWLWLQPEMAILAWAVLPCDGVMGRSGLRTGILGLRFDLNGFTCLIHLAWQFPENWPGWQPSASGAPTKWIRADEHPRSGLLSFAIP
jgi:hypothetical protein